MILRISGLVIQTGREASFSSEKSSSFRDEFIFFRKEIPYQKWVVALGDSLTNGSNVPIHKSYPFRLYFNKKNKLNDNEVKFNVLNHGVCESNTYQSLIQLKTILEEWNRKPDIIVFLGGASDLFSPIENDEQAEFSSIIDSINSHQISFIKSLRVYKIYRGIKLKISQEFEYDGLTQQELEEKLPVSEIIQKLRMGEREQALISLEKIGNKLTPIHLEAILNSVVDNLTHNRASIVEFSIFFLKQYPQIIRENGSYPFHRLVMAFNQQSKYSSDFVINQLSEMLKKDPWLGSNTFFKKYYSLFKNRNEEILRINESRISNLRKIAKLCKENGIQLVLQNYPANFSDSNIALKKISREFNLPFVDNNSVFKKLIINEETRKEYLKEDEHPSEKGYQVMADNVWKIIENL